MVGESGPWRQQAAGDVARWFPSFRSSSSKTLSWRGETEASCPGCCTDAHLVSCLPASNYSAVRKLPLSFCWRVGGKKRRRNVGEVVPGGGWELPRPEPVGVRRGSGAAAGAAGLVVPGRGGVLPRSLRPVLRPRQVSHTLDCVRAAAWLCFYCCCCWRGEVAWGEEEREEGGALGPQVWHHFSDLVNVFISDCTRSGMDTCWRKSMTNNGDTIWNTCGQKYVYAPSPSSHSWMDGW